MGFQPKKIDYSLMTDVNLMVRGLKITLAEAHQIQLIAPPAWVVNDSLAKDIRYRQFTDKRLELLRIMDHTLKNKTFPDDFEPMAWIDIRPDREMESQDITSEVVCLVMGLESVT